MRHRRAGSRAKRQAVAGFEIYGDHDTGVVGRVR